MPPEAQLRPGGQAQVRRAHPVAMEIAPEERAAVPVHVIEVVGIARRLERARRGGSGAKDTKLDQCQKQRQVNQREERGAGPAASARRHDGELQRDGRGLLVGAQPGEIARPGDDDVVGTPAGRDGSAP